MALTRRSKFGEYNHRDTILAQVSGKLGANWYLAMFPIRPATPAIYNVSTTNGDWTRIPLTGTNLSNVLSWRLSERNGNDFRYAFVSSPSAYATGFGWVSENSEITAIWVQRPSNSNIDMELVIWTA